MRPRARAFEEKRDFPRMMVDCEVRCRTTGDGQEYTGLVKNLSAQGVLFHTEHAPGVGEHVDAVIQPASEAIAPLEGSGEVVRVDPVEADTLYEVAVEFNSVR